MHFPGHTIQFLNYGYFKYIKKILELVEINPDKIEWRLYEDWTPYHFKTPTKILQYHIFKLGAVNIYNRYC